VWSNERSKQDLAEAWVGGNAFDDAEVNYIREFVFISGPVCGFASGEVFQVVAFENCVEPQSVCLAL
jgi:hypothetical protein